MLYRAEATELQAVSPATAFLMSSMLADVIDSGTAWKARQLGFRLPAVGQDRHHQRVPRRLVRRLHASRSRRACGSATTRRRQILPGSAYAGDVAVPLWADFMKAATDGDKPEPLVAPRNVVAVQVCRLSGKRPAGGCDAVPVVDDDGQASERSMVGTEYFVRGTEPDEVCHLHVGRSLFGRVAGWFGAAARSGRRDTRCRSRARPTRRSWPRSRQRSRSRRSRRLRRPRRRSAGSGRASSAGATSRRQEGPAGPPAARGRPALRCRFATSSATRARSRCSPARCSAARCRRRCSSPARPAWGSGASRRPWRRRSTARRSTTATPAVSCRSCDRIIRGIHVDVIAVTPDDAGAIKIDAVREALSGCGLPAVRGPAPRRRRARRRCAQRECAERPAQDRSRSRRRARMFVLDLGRARRAAPHRALAHDAAGVRPADHRRSGAAARP